MRSLRAGLFAGLAGLLAACGSERSEVLPVITGALTDLVTPDAPLPDLRAQLTPQVLAGIDGPLIIVELPAAPSQAALAVAGTNGPYVTWAAENSTLVITNRGLVTGTRGLGFDLMNADVAGSLAALASGGGTAVRTHRYLDGVGKVLARRFDCRIDVAGHETVRLVSGTVIATRMREICTGVLGGSFENSYWLAEQTLEIVKSVQWVSPQVGYALIERAK